jgi:hypothetical protein
VRIVSLEKTFLVKCNPAAIRVMRLKPLLGWFEEREKFLSCRKMAVCRQAKLWYMIILCACDYFRGMPACGLNLSSPGVVERKDPDNLHRKAGDVRECVHSPKPTPATYGQYFRCSTFIATPSVFANLQLVE